MPCRNQLQHHIRNYLSPLHAQQALASWKKYHHMQDPPKLQLVDRNVTVSQEAPSSHLFPNLLQRSKILTKSENILVVAMSLCMNRCNTSESRSKHILFPQYVYDQNQLGLSFDVKLLTTSSPWSVNQWLVGAMDVESAASKACWVRML